VQFAFVDMQKLQRIKDLALNRKTKIVFMPMWKSFQDILILHYVNYYADLEIGFTFGNFEDSPKFAFYEKLVKNIGTILIKRQN
jgi:glycerol-3-phosphate O-acyltransferase